MMTGRIYVLKYEGDPRTKFEQFHKMARTMDMDFEGDLEKGHFKGGPYVAGFHISFRGKYEVRGEKIEVTIFEKPALVTWELVESTLKRFIMED
jgi:hypothetical protein